MEPNRAILLDTERRIRATGVKFDAFFMKAKVNRSTWTYWKQGKVNPRAETWARVERTLNRLEARRLARAA
jgi:hypothetical protein